MAARRRISTLSSVTFAIALTWSAVPVALLAYHTLRHGGVLSGSDGPLAGADQLFYMDSIRQTGEHVLIADHFDLVIGHAVYLNPLLLLGGVLWRLGLPLQAAFWSFKLMGAAALAAGAVVLAGRALASPFERTVAVLLALFYLSPIVPLLAWAGALAGLTRYELTIPTSEAMPAWQLWGYPHAAVVVGLLALALSGASRVPERLRQRDTRQIAVISGAACIAAWLHPWQGATFIVVMFALALHGRSWKLTRRLIIPVAAAAVPLAYEAILSHADRAWHVDAIQNSVGHEPVWMILLALVPLAIPAALGIRRMPAGPLRVVLVAWPLAALAVYFGTWQFPYHALQGISLPLAVLAVAACRRAPGPGLHAAPRLQPAAALAAVALTTVPGAIFELTTFRDSERSGAAPYWFKPGERAALAYLENAKQPGGVLARQYLGMAVPAFTGRRTWVGEWTWTPDYVSRVAITERLMSGQVPRAQARRMVAALGARFALTDCSAPARLDQLLGSLVLRRRVFGCAAVYELAPPAIAARARALREKHPL